MRPPVHVECFIETCSDRLGAVTTAASIETLEVVVYTLCVGRKAEVLGNVGVVLRRVVAVGNEPDPEVVWVQQLARFKDGRADLFDVACC